MGLHTGEPAVGGERYVGLGVHRAARIGAVGHGGQVLLSNATRELVDVDLAGFRFAISARIASRTSTTSNASISSTSKGLGATSSLTAERVAEPRPRWRRRLGVLVALAAIATLAGATLLSRAGGGAPTVTAESLVKIDGKTNKVVDVTPVGRSPREVEVVGDYVFVASEADGTLTRVDRRTGAVTNSGQYDASDGLAGQSDKWLWVGSVGRRQVTLVDVKLPVIQVEDRVRATRVPPADTTSTSLAVGGGSLWVITNGEPGVVERWHLHPLRREFTYRLKFDDFGRGIAFGYGAAWSALGSETNDVLRIDAGSGQATRIPVGNYPGGPAIGFGSIWVVMFADDTVWRLDPDTGRPQNIIPVGRGPWSVAVGPGSVWVTNECGGTVSRIDPDTNTVVETIETGFAPRWLSVGDGSVWVGVTNDPGATECA